MTAAVSPNAASASRQWRKPLGMFTRLIERSRARNALYALDDFMLRDMGITRSEIEPAIRGKLHRLPR